MTLKTDLESEVKAIFESTWEEREGKVVPDPKDLSLGNDAVKLKATVLYADMADSTDLVDSNSLGWQTCLEQDLLQSREIGSGILAKAQLLATGLPPRGKLLTHGVPRLRIFQRQCAR